MLWQVIWTVLWKVHPVLFVIHDFQVNKKISKTPHHPSSEKVTVMHFIFYKTFVNSIFQFDATFSDWSCFFAIICFTSIYYRLARRCLSIWSHYESVWSASQSVSQMVGLDRISLKDLMTTRNFFFKYNLIIPKFYLFPNLNGFQQ